MPIQSWVRTVYLYLFALIGLVLLTIGAVRLLDMGLRATIFTQADAQERVRPFPPMPMGARGERVRDLSENEQLTAEERAMLRDWVQEYEQWQTQMSAVDPVRARREREAASSLAMILIGLPLYLFHWRLIRVEARRPAVTDGRDDRILL